MFEFDWVGQGRKSSYIIVRMFDTELHNSVKVDKTLFKNK